MRQLAKVVRLERDKGMKANYRGQTLYKISLKEVPSTHALEDLK